MKNYIIVGSNNFWYSTFLASTQEEIDKELKQTMEGIKDENIQLFVYESKLIKETNH